MNNILGKTKVLKEINKNRIMEFIKSNWIVPGIVTKNGYITGLGVEDWKEILLIIINRNDVYVI